MNNIQSPLETWTLQKEKGETVRDIGLGRLGMQDSKGVESTNTRILWKVWHMKFWMTQA